MSIDEFGELDPGAEPSRRLFHHGGVDEAGELRVDRLNQWRRGGQCVSLLLFSLFSFSFYAGIMSVFRLQLRRFGRK